MSKEAAKIFEIIASEDQKVEERGARSSCC
jgi:hypothetical protein